jgi:hypothetical protein
MIFSILTSSDHQGLRRGLIYKSQIQSIGLSFEGIQMNGIQDLHYFILWNEHLFLLPDLDTEEVNRRHSRSRGRSSSDIGSGDVRRRRGSNDNDDNQNDNQIAMNNPNLNDGSHIVNH